MATSKIQDEIDALQFAVDGPLDEPPVERMVRSIHSEYLEEILNELYGKGQFNWCLGPSPEGWFWYCGSATPMIMGEVAGKSTWKFKGYSPTVLDAMRDMIIAYYTQDERYMYIKKEYR